MRSKFWYIKNMDNYLKKFIEYNPKLINDNSGQVLLFVTVLLAIVLGAGLSISANTLSAITRTSQTDSFQKVTAAAEGGLERYLMKTDSALSSDVGKTTTIQFDGNIKSDVSVSKFTIAQGSVLTYSSLNTTDVATIYFTNIQLAGDVVEAKNLNGSVCFNIETSTPVSQTAYSINVYRENLTRQPEPASYLVNLTPAVPSANTNLDWSVYNGFTQARYAFKNGSFIGSAPPTCSQGGFRYDSPILIRIQPIGTSTSFNLDNVKITLTHVSTSTANNTIKAVTQGYNIISKASFNTGFGDGSVRTIQATKYLDSPSYLFDFVGVIEWKKI